MRFESENGVFAVHGRKNGFHGRFLLFFACIKCLCPHTIYQSAVEQERSIGEEKPTFAEVFAVELFACDGILLGVARIKVRDCPKQIEVLSVFIKTSSLSTLTLGVIIASRPKGEVAISSLIERRRLLRRSTPSNDICGYDIARLPASDCTIWHTVRNAHV